MVEAFIKSTLIKKVDGNFMTNTKQMQECNNTGTHHVHLHVWEGCRGQGSQVSDTFGEKLIHTPVAPF